VRTEVFTLVAASQWFNVLNCQSARASALGLRLLGNRWLLGGLVVSLALQAAVVYAPPLNALFHTVPLSPDVLLPLLALSSTVLWSEEARKGLVRWSGRRRPAGRKDPVAGRSA
jgi:Ca2+-transporting ATPase